MVNLKHVNKKISGKMILNDLNCEFENGVYGLLGPNGAGKTTLLRCLTNLYKITDGEIEIDGRPLNKMNQQAIGYLPQSFGVFQELTIQDSMKYLCCLKKVKAKEIENEIKRCLDAVFLLDKRETVGKELSGGMVRRVGIAQALIGFPKMILLDEPTAGLDPEERMHFKNIISRLGKKEITIVSTHIVEDIEACCDYVMIMNDGQISKIGTCSQITDYARGKVYEYKKGEEKNIPGEYIIEKQYELQGEIYYRVLSLEQTNKKPLTPTLEDGYMCIVKGM